MVLEVDAMTTSPSVRGSDPVVEAGRPSIVPASGPLAAFTIDVEDWYQSSVDFDAPISERVVGNVDRVLALLDAHDVKATFFTQGLVAMRFPDLVRRLLAQGHEVQSHGHTHRPLFRMNRAELRAELDTARKSVEDAGGVRVTAFRAPDFSILRENLWALDALAEAGFEVDSSVFPVSTPRYGIRGWTAEPERLRLPEGGTLLEAPVACSGRTVRLPVGGGGYFRLLPLSVLRRSLQWCVANRRPPVLYFHPYEFNAGEISTYGDRISWSVRMHQGLGRDALIRKVHAMLAVLPFGRLDRVLAAWGFA
jgi:polysaccharide deacetylase family protein (PEP-CTERM system associated)